MDGYILKRMDEAGTALVSVGPLGSFCLSFGPLAQVHGEVQVVTAQLCARAAEPIPCSLLVPVEFACVEVQQLRVRVVLWPLSQKYTHSGQPALRSGPHQQGRGRVVPAARPFPARGGQPACGPRVAGLLWSSRHRTTVERAVKLSDLHILILAGADWNPPSRTISSS